MLVRASAVRSTNPTTTDGSVGRRGLVGRVGPVPGRTGGTAEGQEGRDRNAPPAPVSRTFPAGSYIVRMDQPNSRIADSLMDYQYWSPNDPQKTPYDDTGWTFPELFNVQAVRVADIKVLDAPVEKMTAAVRAKGGVSNTGPVFSSTTTPTSRWSRCATSSRTRRSKRRKNHSMPRGRSSTAARSSSRTRPPVISRRPPRISACRSSRSPPPRR